MYTAQTLAPTLAKSIHEVQHAVRVHPESAGIVSNPEDPEHLFEEKRAFYVEPGFLEMFTFSLTAGNPEKALSPGPILISKSAARKYFGAANPIGQVLDRTGFIEEIYRVAGVFRDVPSNPTFSSTSSSLWWSSYAAINTPRSPKVDGVGIPSLPTSNSTRAQIPRS